jgi:short-subunit dehydrogenase
MKQVVMITGASAGLGRAIAHAFARESARIGLLARGVDGLAAAAEEVIALGGEALVLPADVACANQVELAAAQLENAFGSIDVWVNNAMVSVFSPVRLMTAAEFQRVTEVTYLGYVHGTLSALHRMLPRDRGTIIQVGSALAYRGIPLQAAYCAAKHAVQGFTESLRTELYHDGSSVRVVMVQMPALNTPQFGWVKSRLPHKAQPVPPVFQPEVGAQAVVYAAHHDRNELYVGWPTVKAIAANRVLPRALDHYLAKTGFDAQQTQAPEDPARPNNLFEPLPGDHGTHGSFDHIAIEKSRQVWLDTHRPWIMAGAVAAAGAVGGAVWRRRKNTRWFSRFRL